MRILFITRDLPYPLDNGGRIRVHSLIRHLAANHHVDLLAFDRDPASPGRIDAMREVCEQVTAVPLSPVQGPEAKRLQQMQSIFQRRPYARTAHHSEAMQAAINWHLAQHDYDIVQVEYVQMGYYDLGGHDRCVLDQHNVETEILERAARQERPSLRKLYYWREASKFRRQEVEICGRFPHCLATSARDADVLARGAQTTRFHVVPNGVDCLHFDPGANPAPEAGKTLMFAGSLAYYPNVDGLQYFVRDVLPRVRAAVPDVTFLIVGRDPPPSVLTFQDHPNVRVVADVPDMREYYESASAVVVPLRVGGGTRLKILEAMAMAKPVVSTSVGAEGLDVTDGRDIVLADDPADFADAAVSLLRGERSADLAAAGRALVVERYDWHRIGARLEQVYDEIAHESRR